MKQIILAFLLLSSVLVATTERATGQASVRTQIYKVTGTITTQNLVPLGVATAGSAVEVAVGLNSTLVIQTTGTFTGALSFQVTADGTNWKTITPILNVATNAYAGTVPSGANEIYQADVAGFLRVRLTALAAVTGTATVTLRTAPSIGVLGLDQGLPAGTANIGVVTPTPLNTAGGYSNFHKLVSAASTNLTNAKSSQGNIGAITLINTSAAVKYFKLYNKASAPVLASDVPIQVFAVPAGQTLVVQPAMGIRCSAGIAYAITGAAADTDATAVAAGDVIVNIVYF